ncbi:uncharacterized protein LOC135397566 [Ornithodoros turicata]|uniref:uncharacterized protein LOC135397566 n=1 Tax=Ornithodoros turicata TaxID=34597 RepID=UPI003139E539
MSKFTEFHPTEEIIEDYLDRFEIFLSANGVKSENKTVSLLNHIGKDIYHVLKSIFLTALPTSQTYDALKQKLLDHFAPKRLLIAERAKIYGRYQQERESLTEFVVAIKGLAMTCKFETFLDEALCDRLVVGCRDSEIKKALLELDDDNFDTCFKTATGKELEMAESEELRPCTGEPNTEVHRVGSAKPSGSVARRQPGEHSRQRNPGQGRECSRCGGTGYASQNCRFVNEQCFRCGKRGHTRRMCSKSRSLVSKAKKVSSVITTVTWSGSEPWKVEVNFEGPNVVVEIGAAVSLMSEQQSKKLCFLASNVNQRRMSLGRTLDKMWM